MRSWWRAPLFWIGVLAVGLRLAGLFWGLPASDGWDDDGFAPRNFLTALALTWKPGSFFTYPPFHAFVLLPLTLPGAIMALAHAQSFSQVDVVGAIIQPFYMTWFSLAARLVGIVMSLGILYAMARMVELVAGRRAGLFAATACVLGVGFTYYGQVSNLDVPYLFWSLFALLACMRAIAWHEPRRFWHAALLAAAAVATKDQAAAIFVLSIPVVLLLWFSVDGWPRQNARSVLVTLLFAAIVSVAALLLVDGAITNPSGFVRRIAFLTGPASRDYAAYRSGMDGWLALGRDLVAYFGQGQGFLIVSLGALGVAFCLRGRGQEKGKWVAGLLPFLAMLSFTLCFNFTALRSDARFLLPQSVLAAFYIGIAADRLMTHPMTRLASRPALAAIAFLAGFHCVSIAAAMIQDPRHDAERWMAKYIRSGDTVETYGQNFYLPRFPAHAQVSRVGQGALKVRNPLPGVTEVQAPFEARRDPRFIVVAERWVRHYRDTPGTLPPGRIYSRNEQRWFSEAGARRYFAELYEGRGNYRLAHVSAASGNFWRPVHIHESLNETIHIFERKAGK